MQDSHELADDEDEEGNISSSSDGESVQPEAEKGNSNSEVIEDEDSAVAEPSSRATE